MGDGRWKMEDGRWQMAIDQVAWSLLFAVFDRMGGCSVPYRPLTPP
jgi:hypothetical protein